ncbi:MAG: hypothetical protein KBT29_02625, partial [Prevotellaceae bacterium]|nr:hypothetical protein [Candidatus Minthosoma caballi]
TSFLYKNNGAISHPFKLGIFILVSGEFSDLKNKISKEDFDNIQTDKIVLFECTIRDNKFNVKDCSLKSFIQNL